MHRTRGLVLLVVAGLGLVAYTYLTPPLAGPGLAARLPGIGRLPGDLPVYALRFLVSFLALGVLPFGTALAWGSGRRAWGWFGPDPWPRAGCSRCCWLS